MSPKTLRALGLTPASTPDEVRAIVIRHGVNLAPEDKVCLWRRGSVILIASHVKQWDQLKAILARLNKE